MPGPNKIMRTPYNYGGKEARAYEEHRIVYTDVVDFFLRYIKSNNFLDAGCGTGNDLLEIYRRAGFKGYGCDGSEAMLAKARTKGCASELRVADLDKEFPFDRIFDCIYAHDVLHHLKHPEIFITDSCQHLTNSGVLLIGTETEDDLRVKFTSVYFPGALEADLARYHSLAKIEKAAREAGFSRFETETLSDQVVMDEAIMNQVRTRSHSVLGLIDEKSFQEGLTRLQNDFAAGKLAKMPWQYTLTTAIK